MNGTKFRDRADAGRALAAALHHYANRNDVMVLALPRGGAPVAYEVARELGAPLDIFLVRKLGIPGHEEYAMGAIAEGGAIVLNRDLIRSLGIPPRAVESVIAQERVELERRAKLYRQGRTPPQVRDRVVILIDDGLATGSTMRAAVQALRSLRPARVVVAVPVAPAQTCEALGDVADEIVCLRTPEPFHAVGLWYADFAQTLDNDVRELLEQARSPA
jgi:putative phosphoribosyl transferase